MILHNFWTFNALQSGEHVWQNGEISFTYMFFPFFLISDSKTKSENYVCFYCGTFRVRSGPSPLTRIPSLQLLSFQRRALGLGGASRLELMRTDSPESPG